MLLRQSISGFAAFSAPFRFYFKSSFSIEFLFLSGKDELGSADFAYQRFVFKHDRITSIKRNQDTKYDCTDILYISCHFLPDRKGGMKSPVLFVPPFSLWSILRFSCSVRAGSAGAGKCEKKFSALLWITGMVDGGIIRHVDFGPGRGVEWLFGGC